MTKHGASRLKKLNFSAFLAGALLCVTLFSCKSAPAGNFVHPLDLLDEKSDFYVAIAKSADPELLEHLLDESITNISAKDKASIIDRIDTVYAGLIHQKKNTLIQASASCDVPVKFLPKILTPKSGFLREPYSAHSQSSYDIYKSASADLSFPSDKNCVLGRNIPFMLESYDTLFYSENEGGLSLKSEEYENQNMVVNPLVYDWLRGVESNEGEIRFFAQKPKSFLSVLTGQNLDLKLEYVKGALKVDLEHPDQYSVNLDFEFKQSSFMKVGKAILVLAFGLTDAGDTVTSPTSLSVKNIKISKKQLYRLLVL